MYFSKQPVLQLSAFNAEKKLGVFLRQTGLYSLQMNLKLYLM